MLHRPSTTRSCRLTLDMLNIAKSKVMHISRSVSPTSLLLYKLSGSLLEIVSRYKYLGITVNNSLTRADHVNSVVSKANRTFGCLAGCRRNINSSAKVPLHVACFAYSRVWSTCPVPYTVSLSSKLEVVQTRRANRM